MDTVPCIIVDWDAYTAATSPETQEWLIRQSPHYDLVVFVPNPLINDYTQAKEPLWNASSVIRNSTARPLSNIVFHATAFVTLKDASSFFPVYAITNSAEVSKMLMDEGVLGTRKTKSVTVVTTASTAGSISDWRERDDG